EDEIMENMKTALNDETIGIILITHKLVSLCKDYIYDLKLNNKIPLIVEIPDRHSTYSAGDTIMNYIKEAIGVKF
ncbi:MAG: V-type ATP synthase subunit F, partial [Oscillospiraceae bacterium]